MTPEQIAELREVLESAKVGEPLAYNPTLHAVLLKHGPALLSAAERHHTERAACFDEAIGEACSAAGVEYPPKDARDVIRPLIAAAEEANHLRELVGVVTLCAKCNGTAKVGEDRPEYPASGCCPIGHSKGCECLICQWRKFGYVRESEASRLRAEVARLKAYVEVPVTAREVYGEDHDSGGDVFIDVAEMTNAEFYEFRVKQDSEFTALRSENAALREALKTMIDSAYPHPVEHPTMTAAWKVGRAALKGDPHV